MERLKAAVIGSGFIGAAHVEALKRVPGVDVAALVDIMEPQRKAAEADVPNGFADYREMIETVKPDCIHICTPNHTHKEIAVYAFEHGVNVICEKPMARNAWEAKEMLKAAEKSGLVHAVNLHNRFYPANHQLRNMIQDGALGKIYGVHGGYLQDCFSRESDFNWRMLSANGGSTRVTSDSGSHWIDLAEYVIGSRVKEWIQRILLISWSVLKMAPLEVPYFPRCTRARKTRQQSGYPALKSLLNGTASV